MRGSVNYNDYNSENYGWQRKVHNLRKFTKNYKKQGHQLSGELSNFTKKQPWNYGCCSESGSPVVAAWSIRLR